MARRAGNEPRFVRQGRSLQRRGARGARGTQAPGEGMAGTLANFGAVCVFGVEWIGNRAPGASSAEKWPKMAPKQLKTAKTGPKP